MAIIEVKNFKKSFAGKTVHRGVSFSVAKGQCMGLIGGSGSGKSVLLRSLIALEYPDSGEVIVNGSPVNKLKGRDLIGHRIQTAYVFQGGALFDSMTVFDNIAYPLREHTNYSEEKIAQEIHKILEEFGLGGNENQYPVELSGGMQKRLGLARAIINQPQVVLYDEPTAGLDPYNTVKIQDMILRLKEKGVTSILVTHDMPSAFAVCDKIALLVDGKIVAVEDNSDHAHPDNPLIAQFSQGEKLQPTKGSENEV